MARKNKRARSNYLRKDYRKGGRLYMGGGGTEVGKEAKSYKTYVKKMFGGGLTDRPAPSRGGSRKVKMPTFTPTKADDRGL